MPLIWFAIDQQTIQSNVSLFIDHTYMDPSWVYLTWFLPPILPESMPSIFSGSILVGMARSSVASECRRACGERPGDGRGPRDSTGVGKCPNYWGWVSHHQNKYLLEMKYPQWLGDVKHWDIYQPLL